MLENKLNYVDIDYQVAAHENGTVTVSYSTNTAGVYLLTISSTFGSEQKYNLSLVQGTYFCLERH